MLKCNRRRFLQGLSAAGALEFSRLSVFAESLGRVSPAKSGYKPGRIENEYSLFLPGELEALASPPLISDIGGNGILLAAEGAQRTLKVGESEGGWKLLAVADFNGAATAVFEKHVTHRGAIAFVTRERGAIARIPKTIGNLASIRPRQTNTPGGVRFERMPHFVPGADVPGDYILHSDEDPCYENVAALGQEYIGWSFAGNEQAGPGSLHNRRGRREDDGQRGTRQIHQRSKSGVTLRVRSGTAYTSLPSWRPGRRANGNGRSGTWMSTIPRGTHSKS